MKKKILIIFFLFFFYTEKLASDVNNSIIITVGNNPITRHDLVKEIKFIAILSKTEINKNNKENIRNLAIQTLIRRTIKKGEVDRLGITDYSKKDLELQVLKVANNLGLDKEGLNVLLKQNNLRYQDLLESYKVDYKWNSAIFKLYKNKIALNTIEIEDKIDKEIEKVESSRLFLLSEIQVNYSTENLGEISEKIIMNIKEIGFENTARNLSVSTSSEKGGSLGWISENKLSNIILKNIKNLKNGQISEPLPLNGTLVFIKKIDEKDVLPNLETIKKNVVNQEKMKKLEMFSNAHYSDLEKSIKVKFL